MLNQLTPEQKKVLKKIKFPVIYNEATQNLYDSNDMMLADLSPFFENAKEDHIFGHMIADSLNSTYINNINNNKER